MPLPEQSARNAEESCAQLQNSLGALDAPDAPAVGIAPSTPTNLAADSLDIPDLSAHPYTLPLSPRAHAGPMPIAVAYAGPHPTSPNLYTYWLCINIVVDGQMYVSEWITY